MTAGALATLRDATEPAHRALEDLPLTRRLMSREVTLDDYRVFLQAQLAVFVPWAEAYPRSLRRACRCEPATRLDALHMDLAVLRDGVLDDPALGPYAFDWDDASPAWWGALYVFEGSRLGARVVARHLRQQLGLCVAGALRFLDPVNEAAQPAWSTLVQCIERNLDEATLPLAIEGASRTFAHFHDAFARAEANFADPTTGAAAA